MRDSGGGDGAGGEAASLREAPLPQTPSPEERLGIGLCVSSDLLAHARWGRFLVLGLWSRRLTEPPRPAYVWIWHKLKSERLEGVAGAIGKLPDGLRPPPRVRRGEIPLGSLCGGSQGRISHTKHKKSDGNHHRIFMCPHAACPRRLCQPPWTHASPSEPHPPHRRNHLCRSTQLKRQPLFGRGGLGERGFSQRSRLSPRISYINLFERGFGGERFSIEKCSPPKYLTLSLFSEVVYAAGVGLLVFAAHTDGGNDEDDAGHEEGQHREEG